MATQTGVDLSSPGTARPRGSRIPRLQELGLLVVIVLLGAVIAGISGHRAEPGQPNPFLNFDNLIDGIATPMSVYAIMAVGVTCTIITGGIDISVGSIFALSALGAAAVLQEMDSSSRWYKSIPVAMLVAPGIGLACGLLNGLLVTALRMHPFIVTLGTMSIFRCIGNVATKIKTLPSQGRDLPESFTVDFMQRYYLDGWPGVPPGGVQIMPMVVMLVVVVLGWIYLRLLVAGRENYAIGGNEEAAKFSGLRVNLIKLRVYALSGLTAGIAGMVTLGRFGTVSTNTGTGYELTVIAAAVVGGASLTGGRGTALGALLGALVIRMIENGIFVLKLNQELSLGIVGVSIIVAVAVDQLSELVRRRQLAGAGRH
jgi:ribose/xylose/arabinose/galactoside ABC-type transport system permease subunit